MKFAFLNYYTAQKNSFNGGELEKIWRPTLNFEILADKQSEFRIIDEKFYVKPLKKPYAVFTNESMYEEIYEGSESLIKDVKNIKATFTCNFENLTDYPFNCEKCTVFMYISNNENKLVNLTVGDKILADIPKNKNQFKINSWESRIDKLFRTSGDLIAKSDLKTNYLF